MSRPQRDARFEAIVVKIMAFCKANNITAHTTKGNPLVFRKREPKK